MTSKTVMDTIMMCLSRIITVALYASELYMTNVNICLSLTHSQSIDVPTIYTHRPLKISFAVIICVVLRIWKEWKKKGRKAKVAATETKEINKKITCERWKTRNFIFDFADFFLSLTHNHPVSFFFFIIFRFCPVLSIYLFIFYTTVLIYYYRRRRRRWWGRKTEREKYFRQKYLGYIWMRR